MPSGTGRLFCQQRTFLFESIAVNSIRLVEAEKANQGDASLPLRYLRGLSRLDQGLDHYSGREPSDAQSSRRHDAPGPARAGGAGIARLVTGQQGPNSTKPNSAPAGQIL